MKYLSLVLIAFIVLSCKNEVKEKALTAQEIIDQSIEVSGGEKLENSVIDFDFRGNTYEAERKEGKFSLRRISGNEDYLFIFDVITNNGFNRHVIVEDTSDIRTIKVADSMVLKYSASVNSVHYFSTLPYGLNDKAVNKILLGEEQIKNKNYYKIKVTFNQKGGGEDYEDIFIYWIDNKLFKVDYLAYSYNEDDGKGMRFREAYNERYVNGIRFVDYNNYKTEDALTKLFDLGKAFENNQLKLLSKIELKNVNVDLIDL